MKPDVFVFYARLPLEIGLAKLCGELDSRVGTDHGARLVAPAGTVNDAFWLGVLKSQARWLNSYCPNIRSRR
jgi:hypothetical protein